MPVWVFQAWLNGYRLTEASSRSRNDQQLAHIGDRVQFLRDYL